MTLICFMKTNNSIFKCQLKGEKTMFVKSIMIPKHFCHVVTVEDTLSHTLNKLEEYKIDGLPVIQNNMYVGLLTRHRIYESYFNQGGDREQFLQNTKAGDIATHRDDILLGNEIFEKTLLKLKDFPLLAVVDEKKTFLGIVTRFDVLEQFQSAFGMQKKGVRIAFTSVETEGRLARLSEIAHQYHEHIISLVTFDESDQLVRRIVLKIEKNENLDKFVKKLEASGFRILDISEE